MDEQKEAALEARVLRLEETVLTLTGWLVQAQSGLGGRDYEGIEKLITESQSEYGLAVGLG